MNPKLRADLNAIPAPAGTGGGIILVDPLGLAGEDPVHVPPDAAPLLTLLDGSHSIADLQLAATRLRGGVLVTQATINRFLHRLSQGLLLQDENYESKSQELRCRWHDLTERPALQAGTGYPDDPKGVREMLLSVLGEREPTPVRTPWIVVAPHADIRSSIPAYRAAYARVPSSPPERLITIGTGHRLTDALFSLTEKEYCTPLGKSPCDREAVADLRTVGGSEVAADDWDHRAEHSLEFQYLFLHHLWGARQPPSVPILCGSLDRYIHDRRAPFHHPQVREFLDVLVGIAENQGTLVVAGIDLSHVGPKFGHRRPAESLLGAAKQHEEALLGHLFSGDPDAVWEEALRAGTPFNVCGLSAILILAWVARNCTGELVAYHVWRQPQFASAVTMAAAALYR
jgi:AmmeMemoRadiSam system protein B